MTQRQLNKLCHETGQPRVPVFGNAMRFTLAVPTPDKTTQFSCTLPMPPSVNGLFAGKARRFKSGAYKAWLKRVELMFQHGTILHGRILATYTFHFKADKVKRDIENYCKALSDFLVAQWVIDDDSDIDSMTLKRGVPFCQCEDQHEPFVEVFLEVM